MKAATVFFGIILAQLFLSIQPIDAILQLVTAWCGRENPCLPDTAAGRCLDLN